MGERNIKAMVFRKEVTISNSTINLSNHSPKYSLYIQDLTREQKDKILDFMKTLGDIVCDIHIEKKGT